MLYSAITMGVGGVITFWICRQFGDGFLPFFVRGIICLIVPNIVFAALNFKREEFTGTMELAKRILKRK